MLSHGKSAKWLKQFSLWLSVVFEKIKKSLREIAMDTQSPVSQVTARAFPVSLLDSRFSKLSELSKRFPQFFRWKMQAFQRFIFHSPLWFALFCRLLLKFDDGKNLLLGECTSVAAKFHGVFPWHFWHSPFVAIRLLFHPLLFFSFAGMLRPSLCSPCLMLSRLEISTDRRDVRAVDWNLRAF